MRVCNHTQLGEGDNWGGLDVQTVNGAKKNFCISILRKTEDNFSKDRAGGERPVERSKPHIHYRSLTLRGDRPQKSDYG